MLLNTSCSSVANFLSKSSTDEFRRSSFGSMLGNMLSRFMGSENSCLPFRGVTSFTKLLDDDAVAELYNSGNITRSLSLLL